MSPGTRTRVSNPATSQAQRSQSKAPASPATRTGRAPSRSPRAEHHSQSHSIPISSPKLASTQSPAQPVSRSQPQSQRPHSPPSRQYSPKEVEATEKIQAFWRTHHQRRIALNSIAELAEKFEQLKAHFTLPSTLDYTLRGQHFSVSTAGGALDAELERTAGDAQLAFTPTNAPVRGYEEELSRILTKLDGVQSGGDERVRSRRRELARKVEREAERIEKVKVLVWRAFVERQSGSKQEAEEMPVESSGIPAEEQETPEFRSSIADAPEDEFEPRAEDIQLGASAIETNNMEVVDDTPRRRSEPSVPDVGVVDAQDAQENMGSEPPSSGHAGEPMVVDQSVNAEPLDVAVNDSNPSADAEKMEEEEDKLDEDVVLEMGDTRGSIPQLSEPRTDTVPIIEELNLDADGPPDGDDDVDAEPTTEPMNFIHSTLSASTTALSPIPTSTIDTTPHASEPMSSLPRPVYTATEAGDSDHTPPQTQPVMHETLTPQHEAAPKP